MVESDRGRLPTLYHRLTGILVIAALVLAACEDNTECDPNATASAQVATMENNGVIFKEQGDFPMATAVVKAMTANPVPVDELCGPTATAQTEPFGTPFSTADTTSVIATLYFQASGGTPYRAETPQATLTPTPAPVR